LSPLGAGGMGEVYKARDSRLDRVVALKVITPILAGSSDLRLRFEREARTISQFAHPNICTLYDVGEARPEGSPASSDPIRFLVLEYCEGQTLAERILKGPLPVEQAVRIGIDICNALHRAHAAGIVHRDLKPANVMLTASGAKLLDFGLARPGGFVSSVAAGSTVQSPLTEKGTILGTFQYMAPEQIEGEEADNRSDIWALGCVLYEMITGRRAFDGKSQSTVIAAILEREPQPISATQPLVPPILDAVVRGCLAKAPGDRIQSAHDISLQLRWIVGTESGSLASGALAGARPKPRLRWPWSVGIGAVMLGLAVPAYRYATSPLPPPLRAVVLSIPLPEGQFFTPVDGFSLAPDSNAIAFTSTNEQEERSLWVRRFDNQMPVKIPAIRDPMAPFWSPDGSAVGVFAGGFMQVVNLAAGAARPLIPANPASAAWSATGLIAVSVDEQGLQLVAADGSGRKVLTTIDRNEGEGAHVQPIFLPDTEHVLFTVLRFPGKGRRTDPEIRAVSLRTGAVKPLDLIGRVVGYDARLLMIATADGALRAQPIDPATLTLTGPARPLRQSGQTAPAPEMRYSAAPTGALAYRLTWVDRTGQQLGFLGETANYSNPALSPDGKRLAVGVRPNQSDTRDIWIFDIQRKTSTRLTHDDGDDLSPVWSPDGTRIAFSSDRAGVRNLYAKPATGLGPDELLLRTDQPKSIEGWSSDGRLIFYSVPRGTHTDIDALRLADGTTVSALDGPYGESNATPSPDGRFLAYVSDENGSNEVFVRTYPGTTGKWQISTGGGIEPQWRGDGKELFYIADDELMSVPLRVSRNGLEPEAPRRLFRQRLGAIVRNRFVVAPDGQRFLLNVPGTGRTTEPITVILNWRQMPQ
jgi:eukaryotic-like serine/threonine-protein kinase